MRENNLANKRLSILHWEHGKAAVKKSLTWLASAGDLSHLTSEPLGAELAREVVQGSGFALVQQALEEEEQGHVSGHLVLHCLHDDCFRLFLVTT